MILELAVVMTVMGRSAVCDGEMLVSIVNELGGGEPNETLPEEHEAFL